jgi:hypothetical protein
VDFLSAQEVQEFFEDTPYGTRCWLADEVIDGVPASEVLVAEATVERVNPLLLLARLQVEKSLISQVRRPSQSRVDHALGCGCLDGQTCFQAFAGLDNQLRCGAQALRNLFDLSVAEEGRWRVGDTEMSLDHYLIQPQTHATAALYAYTPWVLPYTGGNWLHWNIARRYLVHLQAGQEIPTP